MESIVQVVDVSLLATLGLIFAVTVVGAYLRSSRRDVCLKAFEGYPVTIERANGKIAWGVMELESTGLELRYRDTVQDANHVESSYLLYSSEFSEIQAIYRYVDELSEEDKERRQKDLQRHFHPGLMRRLARDVQHFFSLAGESMTEVLSLIMGSLKKPAGRYITDASDTHIQRFSSTVVGAVGGAFDPLLERLIGQKVVFDLLEGEELHEHVGILKNYSSDFMELLDVQFPQRQAVELGAAGQVDVRSMTALYSNGVLRVTNHTQSPLLIQSLKHDGDEDLLNVLVDGGETVEIHPEGELHKAQLEVRVVRELDMIVPRTRCIVRHRAERYEPGVLPEIIFDLGVILRGDSIEDAREARLRQKLREYPGSAMIASNLGALLMQKRQYAEAEQLLEMAYAARFSLPDNGRRTTMLLHELRRKMSKDPAQASRLNVIKEEIHSTPLAGSRQAPAATAAPPATAGPLMEGAERPV
ncbi:MAG TPA: hypothetical protein VNK95_24535 [Caldilineaceae bacterium]|nr:hypothetical protein [Caldilineaceae bacterium]